MKLSFPHFLSAYIGFALILLNTSCKKTGTEPTLTFNTEYSSTKDSIAVIDADNTILNIKLTDAKKYSHYTYTWSDDLGNKHPNDTLQLSDEISIDLKNAVQNTTYQNQEINISITLIGDGITKTVEQDVAYHFDATSPIPYVNITTKDGVLPKDRTKIEAEFTFYDVPMENGWYRMSGPHQSGKGTIHARGQGSLGFPKKSFALNLGKDHPISIMGMPESHKWVMIGNWIDTSHLCNKVAYDTYAEMGHYGPQSQHVQVFLNGTYWGLYTFGKKVQRGKEHVDTQKKSNGGFIVKEVDTAPDFTTISGRRFAYEYPDNEEVTDEQKADIQEKINLYESKVQKGLDWQENVNEEAEIDYFMITDVFANPDSYYNGKNVFYFYNKDNKLEPVIWDFIWSFGTPYYVCNGNNPWCYIYSPVGDGYCNPNTPCSSWVSTQFPPANELMYGNPKYQDRLGYNRFLLMQYYMQNAQNVNMFKDRYNDWRTGKDGKNAVLSDAEILSQTDALIKTLRSGDIYKKDSLRWQGEDQYRYGMRFTPEEVSAKIKERLLFMDKAVKAVKVQK